MAQKAKEDQSTRKNNGAVDGKDLEPFSSPELLDELEDWSTQIAGDPALSQAIAEIDSDDGGSVTTPCLKGPKP
ncbi:MAG: hypothetical protein ACE37E_00525 [Hyphomicrobiales bacterium]